nr:caspase family protein [uncultured Novosphingobium sp.]
MDENFSGFRRSLALLIGVDTYSKGIPGLRTPVADAEAIADLLRSRHGYETELFGDASASSDALCSRLADLRYDLTSEDRMLVYFAGHGVAVDGENGPEGFLLPHDAVAGDPATYLAMVDLQKMLSVLPCRHLLLVLDCCFSGAFRWASGRDFREPPRVLHKERYKWFVDDRAWQVLTSAAHDQKALDVVAGDPIGERGETQRRHSPFAAALMDGLAGAADARRPGDTTGDGVITVTELYIYLRERLLPQQDDSLRQTPSLWPLPKHDKGEFVFIAPGMTPDLPVAPPLSLEFNPWRGLLPYAESDADLFFGRAKIVDRCVELLEGDRFLAIVAPSGNGKSSLLHAGVLPRLVACIPELKIAMIRPGEHPFEALSAGLMEIGAGAFADLEMEGRAFAQLADVFGSPQTQVLVVIDQFEELVTLSPSDDGFNRFTQFLADVVVRYPGGLKICVAVRSDFEALFLTSALSDLWRRKRFVPPPMTQDELRRCIEGPASFGVMRIENEALIDELINEVVQTPSPLPLLSFVLSEMYVRAVSRGDADRSLRRADYELLEGVAGALQHRATEEFELDPSLQVSFERLLLRMISLEGGEPARRRISRNELDFADAAENGRIAKVLDRLVAARLVVGGSVGGVPHVEPAHEALIRGWNRLGAWIRQTRGDLSLIRGFGSDATIWARDGRPPGQLWDEDVRLDLVRLIAAEEGALKLNRVESEFLDASVARKRRDRNRRRITASVATGMSILAATVVAFFWSQSSQRATSATLLARTSEITSRLDGPRQLDGLFSAIDAASIADDTFGRMPGAVRGSFLMALERARETDRWPASLVRITDLRVTPDGGEILGVYLPTSEKDAGNPIVVRSWTLKSPHQVRDIRVPGPLSTSSANYPVYLCRSGACFGVVRESGTEVYDQRGRSLWKVSAPTAPAAVDSDGKGRLIAGGRDGVLRRFDHGHEMAIGHMAGSITQLRTTEEGTKILVAAGDRLEMFDVTSRLWSRPRLPLGLNEDDYALAADGSYVLYPGAQGEVWKAPTDGGEAQLVIRRGGQRVERIIAARIGKRFAYTSSTEGEIYVADEEQGLLFGGPLFGGTGPAVAFSRDGLTLVESGMLDLQLKTYDLRLPSFPGRTLSLNRSIASAVVCGEDKQLFWGGMAGQVGMVSLANGATREKQAHSDYVERLHCADGRRPLSIGRDGHVLLWDGAGLSAATPLGPPKIQFRDAAMLLDGKTVVATSGKWVWRVGPAARGARFFQSKLDDINRIAVSRAGVIALGSSGEGYITLFSTDGRQIGKAFQAHTGLVAAMAYSPWSDTLATGGTVGTTNLLPLSLWSSTGEQQQSVRAHLPMVTSVSFVPSEHLILTGGSDGAVRLWDESLLQIGPDLAHLGAFIAAVDAGRSYPVIAAVGGNGAVTILDLGDAALIRHACGRISSHSRLRAPKSELDRRVRNICARREQN